MNERLPRLSLFVTGLWLGGSLLLFGVVAYSFSGIDRALQANAELRARAGFDPKDEAARKTSALWVYTGEQNRFYFGAWNSAQLVAGAAAVGIALLSRSRRAAVGCLLCALAIACVLAFYLAPEVTARGRALDFVPRVPPPEGLAGFQAFHRLYTSLEAAKMLLLFAAAWLSLGPRK